MKNFLASLLTLTMVTALAACTPDPGPASSRGQTGTSVPYDAESTLAGGRPAPGENGNDPSGSTAHSLGDITIGIIARTDECGGIDNVHLNGIEAAAGQLGLDLDRQIITRYFVRDDEEAYRTAAALADSGCDIIFSYAPGHEKYLHRAAASFPEVTFVAAGGDQAAASGLDNLKNVNARSFQSRYVSGIVAGMKLKELLAAGDVTDPYVGYVATYPEAEAVSDYTAFFLGVRSIVPEARMDVQYTHAPYTEYSQEDVPLVRDFLARGAVIIAEQSFSTMAPRLVHAAMDSGGTHFLIGVDHDLSLDAPHVILTTVKTNWTAIYRKTLEGFLAGTVPADYSAGVEEAAVMITEPGPSAAKGTQAAVTEVWEALEQGTLQVFATSRFTVTEDYEQASAAGRTPPYEIDGKGHVVSAFALDSDGDSVCDQGEAIRDGAFAEAVLRSAPYFYLRIDGIRELNRAEPSPGR